MLSLESLSFPKLNFRRFATFFWCHQAVSKAFILILMVSPNWALPSVRVKVGLLPCKGLWGCQAGAQQGSRRSRCECAGACKGNHRSWSEPTEVLLRCHLVHSKADSCAAGGLGSEPVSNVLCQPPQDKGLWGIEALAWISMFSWAPLLTRSPRLKIY